MKYPDGSVAVLVPFCSAGFKRERGSFICTEAYNGSWVDDMRHGQARLEQVAARTATSAHGCKAQGQMSFGDGAQYSGGWLNDARHGFGSYRRVVRGSLFAS